MPLCHHLFVEFLENRFVGRGHLGDLVALGHPLPLVDPSRAFGDIVQLGVGVVVLEEFDERLAFDGESIYCIR